jgi:cell division septation protein DedD
MTENAPKKKPPEAKPKKPPENTRKGSGFWIGLICFSSIWMFGMGILVGRGMAPVQFDITKLEKELASLKEAVLKKENARTEELAGIRGDAPGLEFYEDLKKPKGIDKTIPRFAKQGPRFANELEPLSPATDVAVLQDDEKDILAGKRSLSMNTKKARTADVEEHHRPDIPEPEPKPEPKPEMVSVEKNPVESPAPEPEKSRKSWNIQVSSLKDPAAADKIVAALKQKGYPAYSMSANVAGKGVWYRVRVGPFSSRAPADAELTRLKKDNFNAILVSF